MQHPHSFSSSLCAWWSAHSTSPGFVGCGMWQQIKKYEFQHNKQTKSPLLSPLHPKAIIVSHTFLFCTLLTRRITFMYLSNLNNNCFSISLNFSSSANTTQYHHQHWKQKRNGIILSFSLSGKQVTSQSQQTCYCQSFLSDSLVCLFAQRVVIITLLNGWSSLLLGERWW